jgi:hypothetical protein
VEIAMSLPRIYDALEIQGVRVMRMRGTSIADRRDIMKLVRIFAVLSLGSSLAFAAACSSSSSTGTTPGGGDAGDAASADGAQPTGEGGSSGDAAPGDGGTDLFPSDTQKILFTEKGGFGPGPTDGSTCTVADSTWTITLPDRAFTFKICEADDAGVFAYRSGGSTLSETDFAPVAAALHALTVSTTTMCGADKPAETLTITQPSGDTVYLDDFYHCADDGKVYVAGLDDLRSQLVMLSK